MDTQRIESALNKPAPVHHWAHGIATVVTGFVWAPFWLLFAAAGKQRNAAYEERVRAYTLGHGDGLTEGSQADRLVIDGLRADLVREANSNTERSTKVTALTHQVSLFVRNLEVPTEYRKNPEGYAKTLRDNHTNLVRQFAALTQELAEEKRKNGSTLHANAGALIEALDAVPAPPAPRRTGRCKGTNCKVAGGVGVHSRECQIEYAGSLYGVSKSWATVIADLGYAETVGNPQFVTDGVRAGVLVRKGIGGDIELTPQYEARRLALADTAESVNQVGEIRTLGQVSTVEDLVTGLPMTATLAGAMLREDMAVAQPVTELTCRHGNTSKCFRCDADGHELHAQWAHPMSAPVHTETPEAQPEQPRPFIKPEASDPWPSCRPATPEESQEFFNDSSENLNNGND